MRAVIWNEFGAEPVLRDDLPIPTPGDGEVGVRVRASSVNPVDNAIVAGVLKDMVPHEFPVTLGRDFAGIVEQVGNSVSTVSVGDEVFGFMAAMAPAVHAGSWADMIVVPESTVARKPEHVDVTVAGAAPLAAVTAILSVDALDLSHGEIVLIAGATGGVGSLAVQLAAAAGATVIAPGLPEDEAYLRRLGASDVPSRDGDIIDAVRERYPDGVNAIIDLISFAPGTYEAALKERGRLVSSNNAAGQGDRRTNVMASGSPETLARVAKHLDDGTLEVPIQQTYDIADAARALHDLATKHNQGKRALLIS